MNDINLNKTRNQMRIRKESENDCKAVYEVNASAFETSSEADLVNDLRDQSIAVISLVAEEEGKIMGHIMFSPVDLIGHPELKIIGLAPMAVLPDYQRKGIGSALVTEGLKRSRQLGYTAAVVLGHPKFYPRFGFKISTEFNIKYEYQVPEEAFMAMELKSGALKGKKGVVKFHPAFGKV
jgi:putative acetyltransferase